MTNDSMTVPPSILLNDAQREAVHSDHNRIAVLAGPGAGKTRTATCRIERLQNDGTSLASICVLTYTTNAARELQERLAPAKLGYAGTLHSFLLSLIKQHYSKLGFASSRIGVLDEEQADALLETAMDEVKFRGGKKEVLANLRGLELGNVVTKCEVAAKRFLQTLVQNNLVTFDAILHFGHLLLRCKWSPCQFSHLLIDEAQDSSALDMEIYHAIGAENMYVVGDPDQSIYKFRGSDVGQIMAIASDPHWQVIRLEQNYRSDRLICEAANRLISHNANRPEKQTVPVSTDPGDVRVKRYQNPSAEMHSITSLIIEALDAGQSCAVLVRTNMLVDEWVKFMEGNGVPVQRKKRAHKPKDWSKAKLLIGLFNDPDNDWLCFRALEMTLGSTQAMLMRHTAIEHITSLNSTSLRIPYGIELASYTQELAKGGVSGESIELVDGVIATLAPDATGTDLMAALADQEEREQEIGTGCHVGTIHSAKGREWDQVFLDAAEQEVIPASKMGEALEEERRLFYVGITRARHRLLVTWSEMRKPPFPTKEFNPLSAVPHASSQFICEAGL